MPTLLLLALGLFLASCGGPLEQDCFIEINGVCHSLSEQPFTIDGVTVEGNTYASD